jgi:hypothetical protein
LPTGIFGKYWSPVLAGCNIAAWLRNTKIGRARSITHKESVQLSDNIELRMRTSWCGGLKNTWSNRKELKEHREKEEQQKQTKLTKTA